MSQVICECLLLPGTSRFISDHIFGAISAECMNIIEINILSLLDNTRNVDYGNLVIIFNHHYDDVIMTMPASQITSLTVVYSIVYSGVNQRKHQSSASLAFVREIHRGPVNFPHKWPVTRKMFPFDDVIMCFVSPWSRLYDFMGHPWIWS